MIALEDCQIIAHIGGSLKSRFIHSCRKHSTGFWRAAFTER